MTFNSRNIKKYKGRLIELSYKNRNNNINIQTGEISASTRYHILFNINKTGNEIPLNYPSLVEVSEPKK